ncbi:MAG: circularly permuted type 2 ATP-grasp protein [Pseudomonadota bacterium]
MADELLKPDGSLRTVWGPLLDHVADLAPEALAQRFARGDQYLRDAGVYYRQYSEDGSTERAWPLSHVPVLIGRDEWTELAEGIAQRADLLEHVIADLYGPGNLVKSGAMPAQLAAQNPEWLRPIVGLTPQSGHFLHVLAFEIGRSPDGSWFVLGDRTQAPSGAGFALENRMATTRVFPDFYAGAHIERLAGFFRRFRSALNDQRLDATGRVAILTPGQNTDTYFEHAYIARYLGVMLLECEDLKVVDGRLMVRTINGLEPVSVLWRRLDSRFADPLELDEDSALGTPGMVSALRSQTVTMMNALGSGVLEARALMAFLPRICREVFGEELKLPNIATWWCGQASERQYVRDNLERMMIGPALSTKLPFDIDASTALGGKFRNAAHVPISDWLETEGTKLVGQEAVTLSTTPALIDGKLVPRPVIVRVFAARTPDGWAVMPGGYARIGRTEDPTALAMQDGGSVADVWVVSDTEVERPTLTASDATPFVRRLPGRLPARAADNLFWLGRYVERADFALRMLRAYHLRKTEAGPVATPLLKTVAPFILDLGHPLDPAIPDSLIDLFDQARNCAAKVRDRFSTDGWTSLGELAETARALSEDTGSQEDASRQLSQLLRQLAGFTGLVYDNMFRFAGWRFLTMGRTLERAILMTSLLEQFSDVDAPPGSYDLAIEVGDSVMTHRRRYSVDVTRNTAVDLLALDTDNPRSVMFQVAQLSTQYGQIPRRQQDASMTDATRWILKLETRLAVATPEELTRADFHELRAEIRRISDALGRLYFD